MHAFIVLVLFAITVSSQRTCFTLAGTTLATTPGAFSDCDSLIKTYSSCNKLGPKDQKNACICQQKVFNLIYECGNDFQECFDTRQTLAQEQYVLSNWHKECDTYINFNPTTPAPAPLTTTLLPSVVEYCATIVSAACNLGVQSLFACQSSFPNTQQKLQFSSCLCKEPVISAASVCEYDGNKTCADVPATLSSIDVWSFCPKQAASYHSAHPSASVTPGGSGIIPGLPSVSSHSVQIFSSSALPGSKTKANGAQTTSKTSLASTTRGGSAFAWMLFLFISWLF